MENEISYVSKWHRELEIFSQVKPIVVFDGNVLDVYQYPVDGATPKGSIIRLPEYLHYHFKDAGYKDIIFYDSTIRVLSIRIEKKVNYFYEVTTSD